MGNYLVSTCALGGFPAGFNPVETASETPELVVQNPISQIQVINS
jgi:hypothetical protein